MKVELEEELPQPLAAGTQEEYSIMGNSPKNNNTKVDIKIRQERRVFPYNKGHWKVGGLILLLSPPQT